MKLCPDCNSPVKWTPMPECETETTGRICIHECIRCPFYEETIDRRRIKKEPCREDSLDSAPEKIKAPVIKKNEEDVEDVDRDDDRREGADDNHSQDEGATDEETPGGSDSFEREANGDTGAWRAYPSEGG